MTFPQAAHAAGQGHKVKESSKSNVTPIKQPSPKQEPKETSSNKPKIVAKYDYHGTDYTLIYQAVRFEPKEFKLRRPGKQKDWVWNMRGIPRVIYRLPDVLEEETIFFVEGEKDADNLWKRGLPATTTPQGCASIDKLQYDYRLLDALKNKNVWILPDNDPPGEEYAEKVAKYLYGVANEIKIVKLPVEMGGDVSDFMQGMSADFGQKLGEYVDKAKIYEPERQSITVERLLATEYELKPAIISKGVLHEQEGLLIAGEGGIGKSMLRLEIAVHLAMGWDWLDFFEIPRVKKVLMMQYENSERTEKVRLKVMLQGLGITRMPSDSIQWVKRTRENRPDLTLKSGAERLIEIISEVNPDVVIYDCLSNLHSANENDNIKMRNVMDVFTDINATIGCASIVIHHFGKPQEGSGNRYRVRGASAITDWADCVFTYTNKPHEHKTLRYLENTKMRNAKEIKPILLERNGNFLTTIVDEDTLCPPEKVVEILRNLGGEVNMQKHLVDAIVYETECGERSARTFIQEAEKRKKIIPFKTGRTKGFRIND